MFLSNVAARYQDTILLLGRLALGAIFVNSGFTKLMTLDAFSASLAKRGVAMAEFWGPVGASVEFVGGLMIVLGFATRYACLLMILFVIVATAISHLFWTFPDAAARRTQMSQFFKNLSIIGGFIVLFASGPGRLSLDAWLARRRGGDIAPAPGHGRSG